MHIPEKAIHTGFEAAQADGGYATSYTVEAILVAAAPALEAQALQEAADFLMGLKSSNDVGDGLRRGIAAAEDLLRERADRAAQ